MQSIITLLLFGKDSKDIVDTFLNSQILLNIIDDIDESYEILDKIIKICDIDDKHLMYDFSIYSLIGCISENCRIIRENVIANYKLGNFTYFTITSSMIFKVMSIV